MNPLVCILCALVTALSVLVGNLYYQQNQYRELLTNEAPVSKEMPVRSMAPMVMNHQTMFEGSHMDMSKLVAEQFTEDSGKYLRDLYKEHFGEDDFEEEAVGGKFQDTMKKVFNRGVKAPVKVMVKVVYATVRAILVFLNKYFNIQLNQLIAGPTGLTLQFYWGKSATSLITILNNLVEANPVLTDEQAAEWPSAKEAPPAPKGEAKEKTKAWYSKIGDKFINLLIKAIELYRNLVCNTGLQMQGFQIIFGTGGGVSANMLMESNTAIVEEFSKQFNADLYGREGVSNGECVDVHTNLLPSKDFVDTSPKLKLDKVDEEIYFPFDCPECAGAGSQSDAKES